MAQGIGVGSRVSTSTYRFDDNAAAEETDKLSYTAFGLTWPSPRIIGTVQEKKGNKFSVKFDLDVEANTFEVEAEHLVLLSNETPKQSRSKAVSSSESAPSILNTAQGQLSAGGNVEAEAMSDEEEAFTEDKLVCPICNADLDHIKGQKVNIDRHISKCTRLKEATEDRLKTASSLKRPKKSITSWFHKVPKVSGKSSFPSSSAVVPSEETKVVELEEEISSVSFGSSIHEPISLPDNSEVNSDDAGSTNIDYGSGASDDGISQTDLTQVYSKRKCMGYVPPLSGSIWLHFPIQAFLNTSVPFVLENGTLHALQCHKECYQLFDEGPSNKVCSDLQYLTRLTSIVSLANQNLTGTNTPYQKFSVQQLIDRVREKDKRIAKLRTDHLTLSRKVSSLTRALDLHKKLLVCIQTNNIPRLHDIVVMCMKHQRSIGYIVQKLSDAVESKYQPNYSVDDKELAVVILKFGGPALLEVLHRARGFASTSTAYKFLSARKSNVTSPPGTSIGNAVAAIEFVESVEPNDFISMKMDSTYGDARAKWCPKDNNIYGLCNEHVSSLSIKTEFDTMEDINRIVQLIQDSELHVPKELFVLGLASLSNESSFHPAVIWPTCSHSDLQHQKEVIENAIISTRANFPDKTLINVCSDGDSVRRRIFASMMAVDGSADPFLGKFLTQMPLFDNEIGIFNITVNFDAKHLAKRFRNAIIAEKKQFRNSRVITKQDLSDLFDSIPLEEDQTKRANVTAILSPEDKQNVPYATRLLMAVNTFSVKRASLSFRLKQVEPELVLIGHVYGGVLSHYALVKQPISTILEKVSISMHILLILFRSCGTSIFPAQLYNDYMETCRDLFISAMKFKEACPSKPLYLTRLGTDVLENFFRLARASHNSNTMDCLELINRSQWLHVLDNILEKHPDWATKHYGAKRLRSSVTLDHSNICEWDSDQLTLDTVDIIACFLKGRHRAALLLHESELFDAAEINFTSIESEGATLLKPRKVRVGMTGLDLDWSQLEDEVTDVSDGPLTTIDDMVPPGPSKIDPILMVDGKPCHKATITRLMLSAESVSTDRLKRVRGFTRFEPEKQCGNPGETLMLGDPLCTIGSDNTAKIIIIKSLQANSKEVPWIGVRELDETLIIGCELNLVDDGSSLTWDGKSFGKEDQAYSGKSCVPISPEVSADDKLLFSFDKQLLLDLGVAFQLSGSHEIPVSLDDAKKQLRRCKLCHKNVHQKEMRIHVGQHIFTDESILTPTLCGFCGQGTCSVSIARGSSKKHGQYYNSVSSPCEYAVKFRLSAAAKPSKKMPCCNRPVPCPLSECNRDVWLYNLPSHFSLDHHLGLDHIPEDMVVPESEKEAVLGFKLAK